MITALVFILVISVLIFVHELGHFLVAKKAGMRVDEFGFGFPPRIFGFKYRGTTYTLNLIPFGGFVRIFGEDGAHPRAEGSFEASPLRWRFFVIIAGVLMNIALAILLLIYSNFFGLRVGLFDQETIARASDVQVQILQVAPGSPAESAGLMPIDEIIGFRSESGDVELTDSPEDVQRFAYAHAGTPVTIIIGRGDEQLDMPIALRLAEGPAQGPIGISLALTGVIRRTWIESIQYGFIDGWTLFTGTLGGYWSLLTSVFTSGSLGTDIAGPIGIASMTGQAARVGFTYLLQFVAMISMNLAVLNILPFPALDGGRGLMIVAEAIRGKPLRNSLEQGINAVGFLILLGLMFAVTIKDIVKFF